MRPKIERLEDWTYRVEGLSGPVVSVTNVIKETVPKQLAWWGMQVGCDGVAELLNSGKIKPDYPSGAAFLAALKFNKLTVNDTLSRAGDRGTAIHTILENYGTSGELPDMESIFPEYQGYARGLAKWLLDNEPEFVNQEVMTASLKHRYAGTFDGRVLFHAGKHKGQLALIDLKTSKQIYKDQHFPQVEAYEQAEVELGEPATDIRLVVQISSEGKVRQAVSTYDFSDFEVLLNHFKALQRHKRKKN